MPPSPSPQSRASSDDNASRMSEAALRKKKNADAQAAFRARRANYIATLEETVTNLESVVIQLQDSCRAAQATIAELRNEVARVKAENTRFRSEAKAKDRMMKKWLQSRGMVSPQSDEFPPASPFPMQSPSNAMMPAMSPTHVAHYPENSLRYPTNNDPSISLATSFHHSGGSQDYPQRSPAMSYANPAEGDPSQMDPHRMNGYDQYPYQMDASTSNRDGTWVQADGQPGPSPTEVFDSSGSSSHSPNYVESPTLTASEICYQPQFPVEEQKVDITPLNSPAYVFSSSRSISPALSTPTSTSSTSLAPAPYQFTFPDPSNSQERPDFGYRRPTGPHLTLHGGTADITVAPSTRDSVRFRLGNRANPLTERPITQALANYTRLDNGTTGHESDDSESASYTYSNRSRQRSEAPSTHVSRSPSPGPPPICGTLAVIKAQAFGALRRTRTRGKRTSEGAARAAVEALEARGIGLGISVPSTTKRPRLRMDEEEPQA